MHWEYGNGPQGMPEVVQTKYGLNAGKTKIHTLPYPPLLPLPKQRHRVQAARTQSQTRRAHPGSHGLSFLQLPRHIFMKASAFDVRTRDGLHFEPASARMLLRTEFYPGAHTILLELCHMSASLERRRASESAPRRRAVRPRALACRTIALLEHVERTWNPKPA